MKGKDGGMPIYPYLYCHPISRFFMRHLSLPADVQVPPTDDYVTRSIMSTGATYIDALPPGAVLRSTLALLELCIRDGNAVDCEVCVVGRVLYDRT